MSFFQQSPGRTQVDHDRGQERADKLRTESDRRAEESRASEPQSGRIANLLQRLRRSSSDDR